MRFLLAALFTVGACSPVQAAWARVSGATTTVGGTMSSVSSQALPPLGAAVSVGHRILCVAELFDNASSSTTISSATDSLGNTYTLDFSGTMDSSLSQMAIFSSPVTVAGTPTITLHFSTTTGASSNYGGTCGAYSGLSTSTGAAAIDISQGVSNGSSATLADSGTTAGTTTAPSELKVGFYCDDGYVAVTQTAGTLDTSYSIFAQTTMNGSAATLIEDATTGSSGATARATVGLNGTTNYTMNVVVYKLASTGTNTTGLSMLGAGR